MCAIKFAVEEVLVGPAGRRAARRRRYFSWNGRAEGNFLFFLFFLFLRAQRDDIVKRHHCVFTASRRETTHIYFGVLRSD